jgi:hypothetical protein
LTWGEWQEARERGFVVSMYAGKGITQIELTKRWYTMGPIRVADFDGDGSVTFYDYWDGHAAIDAAIANPSGTPIKVFATGDINGDGVIDQLDHDMLDDYLITQPDTILNYGEARGL